MRRTLSWSALKIQQVPPLGIRKRGMGPYGHLLTWESHSKCTRDFSSGKATRTLTHQVFTLGNRMLLMAHLNRARAVQVP